MQLLTASGVLLFASHCQRTARRHCHHTPRIPCICSKVFTPHPARCGSQLAPPSVHFSNPRLLQCGHMMNVVRGLSCVQPAGKLLRCRSFASRSHAASLHAASGVRSSGLTCRAAADVAQQASEGTAAAAPPPKVRGWGLLRQDGAEDVVERANMLYWKAPQGDCTLCRGQGGTACRVARGLLVAGGNGSHRKGTQGFLI